MSNAALYSQIAKAAAHLCGRPRVFVLAVAIIAAWIVSRPLFGFRDTWQLAIKTSTKIITFPMACLIQNRQNGDTEAIQVMLDERIRSMNGAHTALLDWEELVEELAMHSGPSIKCLSALQWRS